MTENESYQLTINDRGQLDIIDHIESKKRNAICIYNDLGVPPFSAAKAICNKLNEQEERIKELEEENKRLKKENELKGDFRNFINEDMVRIKKENEQLKNALKNSYLNEICENCKHGYYYLYDNQGFEGDFECKKGHDSADCDGLKDCDDFELEY